MFAFTTTPQLDQEALAAQLGVKARKLRWGYIASTDEAIVPTPVAAHLVHPTAPAAVNSATRAVWMVAYAKKAAVPCVVVAPVPHVELDAHARIEVLTAIVEETGKSRPIEDIEKFLANYDRPFDVAADELSESPVAQLSVVAAFRKLDADAISETHTSLIDQLDPPFRVLALQLTEIEVDVAAFTEPAAEAEDVTVDVIVDVADDEDTFLDDVADLDDDSTSVEPLIESDVWPTVEVEDTDVEVEDTDVEVAVTEFDAFAEADDAEAVIELADGGDIVEIDVVEVEVDDAEPADVTDIVEIDVVEVDEDLAGDDLEVVVETVTVTETVVERRTGTDRRAAQSDRRAGFDRRRSHDRRRGVDRRRDTAQPDITIDPDVTVDPDVTA